MALTTVFAAFAALVAIARATPTAPRYPAGVNPEACPSYPYCDPFVPHASLTQAPAQAPLQQSQYAPAQYAHQQQQPQYHQQQQPQYHQAPQQQLYQPQQQFASRAYVPGPQQGAYPVQAQAAVYNHQPAAPAISYPHQGAPAAYDARQSGYARSAAPAAAAAPGPLPEQFPAGVNPAECPNFPYCHDGLNGNHAVGHAPQQQAHARQLAYQPQPQSAPAQHHRPAAYSSAPAYVNTQPQQQYAPAGPAAPVPGSHGGAKYPHGVNPAACPNYPFCS